MLDDTGDTRVKAETIKVAAHFRFEDPSIVSINSNTLGRPNRK